MADVTSSSRLGRFALVASLAVNVLLIGLIIGSAVSGRESSARNVTPQLGQFSQVLPREDRAKIGRDIRRAMRDENLPRPDRGGALQQVVVLLQSDPFDGEAFTMVIQNEQDHQDRVRAVALRVFVDHIGSLPLEDRLSIAETLKSRPSGPRPPKDDD